ncbi:MAG: MASE1 domain-containing protein, partial [Phycisphaerae bacterium]|nr:MASE1 domain-containing protein [Phycisphaerae bacterium]
MTERESRANRLSRAHALRYLGAVALVAGLYFAMSRLNLPLRIVNWRISALWPASGLALAAVLLGGYRLWVGVAIGAAAVSVATRMPWPLAAGSVVAATAAPLLAAWVLRRIVGLRNTCDRVLDIIALTVIGGGVSGAVTATVGLAALCLAWPTHWRAFWPLWGTWWLGDWLGVMLVGPAALVWATRWREAARWRVLAEGGAALSAVAL